MAGKISEKDLLWKLITTWRIYDDKKYFKDLENVCFFSFFAKNNLISDF